MFADSFGLKGWSCRRPLNGTPGRKGIPGEKWPPLVHHQYLCVTNEKGEKICGGLTTDGNPFYSSARLTRPDEDYYHPDACEEIDDDADQCFEQCVIRNFGKPQKRSYGIGWQGKDCQEYVGDIRVGCKMLCRLKKGR